MVQIKFSDIGEGMTEGEIIHYFVEVGDEVSIDQPLVELQTDKMVAEIPAPSAGKITSILYEPGDVVIVGTVIMEIANDKQINSNNQEQTTEIMVDDTKPLIEEAFPAASFNQYNRILAAPYTRKIARELDVDIEEIKGTGPSGRVIDEDVYRFANQSAPSDDIEVEKTIEKKQVDKQGEVIPFTGIRKQIAQKMSYSLQTIPHVTHYDEVDVTYLIEASNALKESKDTVSLAAFFVKAIVVCLKEYKLFNARLDEEAEVIQLLTDYHIGIATNTENGLMVPVVPDVNQKSIRTIDQQMKAVAAKANSGQLASEARVQGTFTVNNVGPYGGTGATPIINHPQTGIMTFHKTRKMPVVMKDDEINIRSIMNVSLSFDHRVIDGAQSIAFTNRFKELIENPAKLLLELM
ncbi:dihydrolipoamide acetyltransferase family protein [Virgibacillus salexigens]|uniref:Dihydrolipoamide acetyltransferase component of pyruvate dehydrogenase complex n=1 Tax=Virgibacillus kapii TaxID=1638645 RepID=A0ABQ2DSK0_9BACI|nr:dihydrolipoamide acetyltransferase family protein [Virgibacillus kapii]GGJ71699.1 dihydrolipoamide acetyltransferase component of pyruvate dehydrogenase complex [Virgibacillus kapii]